MRKRAIVVGSGAGGCAAARDLAAAYDVTVLEAGREFRPFALNIERFEGLRRAGLFVDARMIQALFPHMHVIKTREGLVHVNGRGLGGTTTISTGNAVRCDEHLAALGIDLDGEFEELKRDVPQSCGHRSQWNSLTERMFEVFANLGLKPFVTPKLMVDPSRCVSCGRCVLGCRYGAKWTADMLVRDVSGVEVVCGSRVTSIDVVDNEARGVLVRSRGRVKRIDADLVVLAAGGLSTPQLLRNAGVQTSPTLFVDPVICVAAPWPGARMDRQIPMPFVSDLGDYILSPYFDWLSFFFDKSWRRPASDIVSVMVKFADESAGHSDGRSLVKPMGEADKQIIERSCEQASAILAELGVREVDMFTGILNAGHPGGGFPLGVSEAQTLHHSSLPNNVYVADASLLPRSLGKPPILTIMALAKRVAKRCLELA